MMTRLSLILLATTAIALTAGGQDTATESKHPTEPEIIPLPPVAADSGPFFPIDSDTGVGVIDARGNELVETNFNLSKVYATRSMGSLCSLAGQESLILASPFRWIVLDSTGSKEFPPPYPNVGNILNLGDSLFSVNVLGTGSSETSGDVSR